MDIIQYECDQGVIMNQLYFCKRESFMKHLMTCFHSPKDHLLHIGIESLQPRNVAYCGKHFLDLLVIKYWYQYILEKGQTIQEQIFTLNFKFEVLTANEWGGVAFAMALIVHSKKGYVLIKKIY